MFFLKSLLKLLKNLTKQPLPPNQKKACLFIVLKSKGVSKVENISIFSLKEKRIDFLELFFMIFNFLKSLWPRKCFCYMTVTVFVPSLGVLKLLTSFSVLNHYIGSKLNQYNDQGRWTL